MQEITTDLGTHGFRDVFFSKGWRVSFADYNPLSNDVSTIHKMEKHLETDEVFSLQRGTVYLATAGKGEHVGPLVVRRMQGETLYVIEKGEWHVGIFQQGAAVLIVENEAESLSRSAELDGETLAKLVGNAS